MVFPLIRAKVKQDSTQELVRKKAEKVNSGNCPSSNPVTPPVSNNNEGGFI